MLVYASTNDLASWMGTPAPANATALLRTASLAVREATELAFYATDTTGLPTDATILQAFSDATCSHAAALYQADVDPNAGGVLEPGVHASDGIGSARITYSDAALAAEAKRMLVRGLCQEAQRILRNAGLTPTAPWIVG